jgi:hypothetical protein
VIEELEVLRERARVAAARGDRDAALAALFAAAKKTDTPERDYVAVLRPLADLLAKTNDPRASLTVVLYLAPSDPTQWARALALLPAATPEDRARVLAARGQPAEAAREAETSGKLASAAFYREMGGQWAAARTLWARLASRLASPTQSEDMYVAALVNFNLARCARRCQDDAQSREAARACVRLLEEAADRFESSGLRERAFDCFQVLAQIGRASGTFEDVLEGFVNCIRILRQDRLESFALEHYEESIDAAAERGETSAAATLAREAAGYARSLGLASVSNGYALRQAELWRISARQHVDRGAPLEIAENALLASVLAFAELGQAAQVRQSYAELARLDLDPVRRDHYARAENRYAKMPDEPLERASASRLPARGSANPSEVWREDVVEWERAGCASEVCADVILDRAFPEFMRRKAMLARITALEIERHANESGHAAEDLRKRLARELGQIQLYAVLSPLEHLFGRPDSGVKIAVLEAIESLFFKRSFVTVRAGLADRDPAVVAQALRAVESQRAFEPLTRLVRESADHDVRAAALRALARVDTIEASEFLQGVADHGSPADRAAVADAMTLRPSNRAVSD